MPLLRQKYISFPSNTKFARPWACQEKKPIAVTFTTTYHDKKYMYLFLHYVHYELVTNENIFVFISTKDALLSHISFPCIYTLLTTMWQKNIKISK